MDINELQKLYARHPKLKVLGKMLVSSQREISLAGLQASAAPLLFASLPLACPEAARKYGGHPKQKQLERHGIGATKDL